MFLITLTGWLTYISEILDELTQIMRALTVQKCRLLLIYDKFLMRLPVKEEQLYLLLIRYEVGEINSRFPSTQNFY